MCEDICVRSVEDYPPAWRTGRWYCSRRAFLPSASKMQIPINNFRPLHMLTAMTRKRIAPKSKLTVKLTAQEWADLTKHTFIETEFFQCAVVEGTLRRAQWSLEDIEVVQGHVAATSNHTDDPKLEQRLSNLCDKLQRFLDEYDDHSED